MMRMRQPCDFHPNLLFDLFWSGNSKFPEARPHSPLHETGVALSRSAVILPDAKRTQSALHRIHIEQLEISAHIGVPDKERYARQRLTVSISFWPYSEQHYAGSVYHRADVHYR